MAGISTLEVEILANILEYVDDEHPESTPSIAIANKHIYNTSQLVSHRRKTLFFEDFTDIEDWSTRLLENPTALRGTRHVTVNSDRAEGNAADLDVEQWDKFATFINKASRLCTMNWKCKIHMPLKVINALEKYHPNLQLKIYDFTRPSRNGDHQHPAELALASSPLLVGISAKIYYDWSSARNDLRELALRRIIAKAPKLTFVSVLVDQFDRGGHRGASQAKKDAFYAECSPNPSVKTLVLDGYPLGKATLVDWADFVDLSTLENIKCLRGGRPYTDYFAYALKVLPKIKHVSLNLRFNATKEFRAAVENYLSLCPTLESLSLWSWMGRVKLNTILRHGPTLQILQLHEREEGTLGRSSMTADMVKSIREACPHLRDLTIDMRRESRNLKHEDRNDPICKEIALFGPQLDRLQVYFDLGIASIWSGAYNIHTSAEDSDSDSSVDSDDDGEESDDGEMQILPEEMDSSDDDDNNANPNNNAAGGGGSSEVRVAPEPITFKIIKPSKNRHIETYVTSVWKEVFGDRRTGPRQLDVKFGEWEQKTGVGAGGPGNVRSLENGLKSFGW